MTRFPRTVFSALLLAIAATAQAVTVVPLNDTGQTLCYDSAGTVISCASSGLDDGRYGRDAAASVVGQLSKVGAGAAGFDFTKIANDGSVLPASAGLGSNPTDWACTRDNVTGLIWEVKTNSGLRDKDHYYTWYSTDTTSNGGNVGNLGFNTCANTLSTPSYQCNTEHYVATVNATTLCGYSDWRLPSLKELQSLVDLSVPYGNFSIASIDATYFPYTSPWVFWSANNDSSNPASAWTLSFNGGFSAPYAKYSMDGLIRLVRGSQ